MFDVVAKVCREGLNVPHGDVNKPKKLKEEYLLDIFKQNNSGERELPAIRKDEAS